jgi:hypothetical protein
MVVMPDPERLTISSTQSAALPAFNCSPYLTPWMLYQHFKGHAVDVEETARMEWGTALQPLVLAKARDALGLEIVPNYKNEYVRSNAMPMGCTVDAIANDPQRGPGVVEVKCVFDYGVWAREWSGGKAVPRHHEIQLQHHMAVGDGKKPYDWGVFAVWVCADLQFFERTRDDDFSIALAAESVKFLGQVESNQEPDPFGEPIESELLRRVFPINPEEVLDLRNDPNAHKWADHVRMIDDFRDKSGFYSRAALKARMEFLSATKSAGKVLLPGVTVDVKAIPKKAYSVKAHVEQRVIIRATDDDTAETGLAENPFG